MGSGIETETKTISPAAAAGLGFGVMVGAGVLVVMWQVGSSLSMYPGVTMLVTVLVIVLVAVVVLVYAITHAIVRPLQTTIQGIVGVLDADARGDAAVAQAALVLGMRPQGMAGRLGDGSDLIDAEVKISKAGLQDAQALYYESRAAGGQPTMPPPGALFGAPPQPAASVNGNGHNGPGGAG